MHFKEAHKRLGSTLPAKPDDTPPRNVKERRRAIVLQALASILAPGSRVRNICNGDNYDYWYDRAFCAFGVEGNCTDHLVRRRECQK